jgi:hypothetical protein
MTFPERFTALGVLSVFVAFPSMAQGIEEAPLHHVLGVVAEEVLCGDAAVHSGKIIARLENEAFVPLQARVLRVE